MKASAEPASALVVPNVQKATSCPSKYFLFSSFFKSSSGNTTSLILSEQKVRRGGPRNFVEEEGYCIPLFGHIPSGAFLRPIVVTFSQLSELTNSVTKC